MGVPSAPAPTAAAPAKPKTAAPDAPVPAIPTSRPTSRKPRHRRRRRRCRRRCGTWPSAQQLLAYIQQIGVEGLNPADYDPAGPAGRDPGRQSGRDLRGGDASASTSCRPTLRWATSGSPAGSTGRVADPDLNAAKQDALLRSALAQHNIAAALNGLLPTHPQYAALKEALAVTPASRRGEARPHPAQPRSLALAAARSRQQIHHRQRAGLLRDPGREWRQSLEAAGDRRQAVDADAAAQRDRGRGDHQSGLERAQEHREGSGGQEGLHTDHEPGRQTYCAGSSRRGRPMRSASSSS